MNRGSGSILHISGAMTTWRDALRLTATAAAFRAAQPGLSVVPMGYGAADPERLAVFADLVCCGKWPELDTAAVVTTVSGALVAGGRWISGYAPEAAVLAAESSAHPGLIVSSPECALRPDHAAAVAAEAMNMAVLQYLSLTASRRAWHGFGREWGWQLVFTAAGAEVIQVADYPRAMAVKDHLLRTWPADVITMRPAHSALACATITNHHRIAAVAWRGRLVHAVSIQEQGGFAPLADVRWCSLENAVHQLGWTGAFELELAEIDGAPTLLSWTPGFPVWVQAAAAAGFNGPAALLEVAEQDQAPAGEQLLDPSQPPVKPLAVESAWRQLSELSPAAFCAELHNVVPRDLATPAYRFLPTITANLWDRAASAIARSHAGPLPHTTIAVSIKTNPAALLLTQARSRGFMAEAISRAEVDWARRCGYGRSQIILNGPGKHWPPAPEDGKPLLAVFADSLPELRQWVNAGCLAEVIGFRFAAPGVTTRFGIAITEDTVRSEVATLLAASECPEVGVSFHFSSQKLGWRGWWRAVAEVVAAASELQRLADRPITVVDLGGGWFPDDWYTVLLPGLPKLEATIVAALPQVRRVYLEPGRALAQSTFALVCRVLEIRRCGIQEELIVDGSIAELHAAQAYPRHICWRADDSPEWTLLESGGARILGRLCIETDVLAVEVALPSGLSAGDLIAFSEAGSYDMSMAYSFARGAAPLPVMGEHEESKSVLQQDI